MAVLKAGTLVTLTPEKPAAGGRMVARRDGMVVLVAGAIPGEPALARVDRVDRSMAWASVVDVPAAHPSRRRVDWDPRCGGAAYAHVAYPAQLELKADLVRDALVRIGRHPWAEPLAVAGSPEEGYRMRARLHARDGRLGFFVEGTHEVCDPGPTRQLLASTVEALERLGTAMRAGGLDTRTDVDVSETMAADQRAVHLSFDGPPAGGRVAVRPISGITGLSWSPGPGRREQVVFGEPWVTEQLEAGGASVRLRRHVRAFFQGNRYLLPDLVARVGAVCPEGPVVDLYAGAGLFAITLAATGRHRVTAVEGDPVAASDLRLNAQPFAGSVETQAAAVERFVADARPAAPFTLILDPPRSGMTRQAADGAARMGASRVVLVSCDVATFARDVRRFVDRDYRLVSVEGFDLFPNTPHVEVLAVLDRSTGCQ